MSKSIRRALLAPSTYGHSSDADPSSVHDTSTASGGGSLSELPASHLNELSNFASDRYQVSKHAKAPKMELKIRHGLTWDTRYTRAIHD